MESGQLVSVICLCHNHAPYVNEALESVLWQTHRNVELIIVDDGSTDGSKEIIGHFLDQHPEVAFIDLAESIGNCAAFNRGWRMSSGQYLIDLAADDVLLPHRIEVGLKRLDETETAIHFSDAEMIKENGESLGLHNARFTDPIPEGDLYEELIKRYLICPPTMMFSRKVMEKLEGYDESLAFEDFDFWVRSARYFAYAFSDTVLVKKRVVKNSHASSQEKFMNAHQETILKVCWKILEMNRTDAEGKALKKRCWHEIRQCIKKGNLGLIQGYLSILKQC